MELKYYVNCDYYPPRKRKATRVSIPMDNYSVPEGLKTGLAYPRNLLETLFLLTILLKLKKPPIIY